MQIWNVLVLLEDNHPNGSQGQKIDDGPERQDRRCFENAKNALKFPGGVCHGSEPGSVGAVSGRRSAALALANIELRIESDAWAS